MKFATVASCAILVRAMEVAAEKKWHLPNYWYWYLRWWRMATPLDTWLQAFLLLPPYSKGLNKSSLPLMFGSPPFHGASMYQALEVASSEAAAPAAASALYISPCTYRPRIIVNI